ncbi:hypothetical protein [Planctomycetes bacterium CA13]
MKIICLFLLVSVSLVGCNQAGKDPESAIAVTIDGGPPEFDDQDEFDESHAHPSEGPHGGDLVELGNEKYHAELTHNETGIDVYILNSAATEEVAIKAASLTISLKHDGKVNSFELQANPQTDDPSGKSSRFSTGEPSLPKRLDEGAEGALTVNIDGKSFTGKVAHDHDHDHDHEGHDHD